MSLDWIIQISNFSLIILSFSLLICVFKFSILPQEFKIFSVFLLINITTELIIWFIGWKLKISNLPLLHLYTLLEFIILSLFYKRLLKNEFFQKYFLSFVFSISILIILNSIFFESIYSFNSNAKSLVQLILIAYSISYLFNSYGKTDLV